MSPAIHNYLARCRDLIRRHGYMVQPVISDGFTPNWSYTVGLSKSMSFDLVVFGLPADVASALLNPLVKRLQEAPIDDFEPITKLANFPMRLVPHEGPVTELRVANGLGLTPDKVRFLQWPDTAGRFPGEPSYAFLLTQTFDDLTPPKGGH